MRKIVRTTAVSAAAVAAVLSTTVAPASADEAPPASIAFAGPVVVGLAGEVHVPIAYTCGSETSPASHLYVAVKQGPRVNTTDRSSSSWATSYYSTNWSVDAGPNALVCDGTAQTQTVVLQPEKGGDRLHSGRALVQLCMYDLFETGGRETLDYTMQRVFVAR